MKKVYLAKVFLWMINWTPDFKYFDVGRPTTTHVFSISAQHLLEIAQHSQSVQDLASAINESDLEMFLFPDDFMTKLFDILR